MNSIYAREKILVGALEGVYGQQEALDPATQAIRTLDCAISWNKDTEETNEDGAGLDHGSQIVTSESVNYAFKTYFAGSGNGGDPMPWSWLAKICGFEEQLDVGPPGTSTLQFTNNPDSASMHYRNGRNVFPTVGVRGGLKLDLTPKKLAMLEFALKGLKLPPIDEAFPAGMDLSGYKKSRPVNAANTNIANLFGYDVCLSACTIDIGSNVPHIDVPNCELIDITARAATANITFLDPGIGVHNFYDLDSGDLGNFNVSHNDGRGGVLKVGSDAGAQLVINDVGEFEGRTAISATVRFVRTDAGQSDFKIINEYA